MEDCHIITSCIVANPKSAGMIMNHDLSTTTKKKLLQCEHGFHLESRHLFKKYKNIKYEDITTRFGTSVFTVGGLFPILPTTNSSCE